jgi:uncharacterized membrane protein
VFPAYPRIAYAAPSGAVRTGVAVEPLTRDEAQKRADELELFAQMLARLEREGVVALSDEQRSSLESHRQRTLGALSRGFDIDRDTRGRQLTRGMRVASFLGALAFAASVFFLFRRFWGVLGSGPQVAILVTASLATLALTAWLQRRDGSGYFTRLAATVAFACFVLNVSVLGGIFNITPSDRALLPWAAYALLLAYACDLRLLLAAGLICITVFLAARAGEFGGLYWLDFGERPENFYPAALVMFLAPVVVPQTRHAGFAQIYRVFGLLALFLPMLALAFSGEDSYLELAASTIRHSYQALGFVLSAAAVWLGLRAQWPEVINTAVVFFVVFLFTKFFDWWWEVMPKYLFFAVLGLTALLALFVLRRLRAGAPRAAAAEPRP